MKTDNVKFVETHPYLACKFVHKVLDKLGWDNFIGPVCLLKRKSDSFRICHWTLGLVLQKKKIVEKTYGYVSDLTDQEVKKKIVRNFKSAELLYWKPSKHGFSDRDYASLVEFEGLELLGRLRGKVKECY